MCELAGERLLLESLSLLHLGFCHQGCEGVAFFVRPLKILLIEDFADGRESLAALLRVEKHLVDPVATGTEGLKLAKEQPFDVALIDLSLPDIDGLEIARQLRNEESRPFLIACTGWGRGEDVERTREAGFDFHLTKPIRFEELVKLLASIPRRDPAAA